MGNGRVRPKRTSKQMRSSIARHSLRRWRRSCDYSSHRSKRRRFGHLFRASELESELAKIELESGPQLGYVTWSKGNKKVLIYHEWHRHEDVNKEFEQYPGVYSLCERPMNTQPNYHATEPTSRFEGEAIDIRSVFDGMLAQTAIDAYLLVLAVILDDKKIGDRISVNILAKLKYMAFLLIDIEKSELEISKNELIAIKKNKYKIRKGSIYDIMPNVDSYFDSFRDKNPIPMKDALWVFEAGLLDAYIWSRINALLKTRDIIAVHVGHAHATCQGNLLKNEGYKMDFMKMKTRAERAAQAGR
jgi:hypothetical protein